MTPKTEEAQTPQLTEVDHRWRGVPTGWPPVSSSAALATRERVLDAVQAASTSTGLRRLEASTRPESLHPVHLLGLWPSGPTIEANDLLLVGLLGHALRLEACLAIAGPEGPHVGRIARALRAVPTGRSANMADVGTLLLMDELWCALFDALRDGGAERPAAAAAAHALCARKAPRLFPLSTQIVQDKSPEDQRMQAWQTYRDLDDDSDIRTSVDRLVGAVQEYDRTLGRRLRGMWTVPMLELCTTLEA